jgi:ketosteroid isomerase-like protein
MNLEETDNATAVTQQVLAHHLECLGNLDLAGTMADYSDDSTLFTPDGLSRGSAAIRGFFAELFEEFAKPGLSYEVLRQEVSGDIAYIVWTAETADHRFEIAADTFVVRNGKIANQTFAGKISPKR